MAFSKQQATNQLGASSAQLSKDDLKEVLTQGAEKLNVFEKKAPGVIARLWSEIKLMVSLIKDYSTGSYTDVPWRVISAITAAVAYFVSPVDLIPDVIVGVGYIDDAFVLKLALDLASDDLRKYAVWKQQIEVS